MDVYLGMIMIFGGNFAPMGWAMCQGQLLPIAQNQALFALLGTFYGGNGTSTFGLPNLQGRVAIGMGSGAGLTSYAIGQTGGAEKLVLTTSQLPSHNHGVICQNTSADNSSPVGAYPAVTGSRQTPGTNIYTQSSGNNAAMAQNMIGLTGSNQPVPTVPPYIALNYIIALQGIFPPHS